MPDPWALGGAVKGIVFNLAEEVVSETHGSDAWDDLLDAAGVDGVYTSLGSYPDDDMHRLIKAGAEAFEVPPYDVLKAIGTGAMPLLAERYPEFFEPHTTARSFTLTVNDIIHPEVRKLYPGADVPEFDFDDTDPDELVITYHSGRQLCALAEGFIEGAAAHYGERAVIRQERCMPRGDECCVLHCAFVPT
jgi:hypothetical protein